MTIGMWIAAAVVGWSGLAVAVAVLLGGAIRRRDEQVPDSRYPLTVTLAWTPDQNFGAVSTLNGRAPIAAVVGQLRAGDPAAEVAEEFGITETEVVLLARLAADLAPDNEENP